MADRRFGGFWRRLLAYMIDKFILYFVSLFLFFVGLFALQTAGVSPGLSLVQTGELPPGMGLFATLYVAATLIAGMSYFTWFHGTTGQTPGKRLLGLRVIQASGEEMTLGIAFLRWVGALVSAIFLWLGFLWVAFDRRKQGWHDKIAATMVIRWANGFRATGAGESSPAIDSSSPNPGIRPAGSASPGDGQRAGQDAAVSQPEPQASSAEPLSSPVAEVELPAVEAAVGEVQTVPEAEGRTAEPLPKPAEGGSNPH